jgi:hypothetical protein
MRKEDSKGGEHNEFPKDSLVGSYCLSSLYQKSPMQLHCVKTLNNSNHRHRRQMGQRAAPRSASSATAGNSEKRSVSTGSQFI